MSKWILKTVLAVNRHLLLIITFLKTCRLKILNSLNSWVVYYRATWCTFHSKLEKSKKILSKKKFRKWSFLTLILKNFLYFRNQKPPKNFLCFRKRSFLMLQETFYISGSNFPRSKCKKTSYISGGNLQSLKVKKYYTFSYKEVKFSKLILIYPMKLTPHPVFFRKMYLLKRGWNPGFLWLLILSQNISFLKISLNLLKSFRRYEEILCRY